MYLIIRIVSIVSAALVAAVGLSQSALAQPEVLEAPVDGDWKHKWTGVTVPPILAGFERRDILQYAEDQLNVSVQLFDASKDTSITIYVYRAGAANISIWADRAVTGMVSNSQLGRPVDGQFFRGRFTPLNGSGQDSAFHAVTPLEDSSLKATGLSLFAHDDWLIKIRASSSKYSDTELTGIIGKVISALNIEESKKTYPPVEFIEDCEEPAKFETEVQLQQMDLMGQLLISSVISDVSVAEMGADDGDSEWCRDATSRVEYGVYRRNGDKGSVVVALGDSGVNATISKMSSKSALAKIKGYMVVISDGVEQSTWPLFNKKPHPGVVFQNYGAISPISSLDLRPGSEGGTTIFVSPESLEN